MSLVRTVSTISNYELVGKGFRFSGSHRDYLIVVNYILLVERTIGAVPRVYIKLGDRS